MSLVLRAELAGKVRSGEKQQHLLRVERYPSCPFKLGESYAVQGYRMQEGRPRIAESKCRIRVVGVWKTTLDALTDEDARQEGFEDRSHLFAWWRNRFNEGPLMEVPLWVVRFELDHSERPRYLARQAGLLQPPQYVSSAARAIDKEEAVPESAQEAYSLEAEQTAVLQSGHRERERREQWERAQRIRRVEALSRLSGVDVSTDLRAIDRRLDAAERKLGRRAA